MQNFIDSETYTKKFKKLGWLIIINAKSKKL